MKVRTCIKFVNGWCVPEDTVVMVITDTMFNKGSIRVDLCTMGMSGSTHCGFINVCLFVCVFHPHGES